MALSQDAVKAADMVRNYSGPRIRIMEVCGTHTHEIFRQGIRQLLPESIELISGPGCPVCVTPVGYIDEAVMLALEKGVKIFTFGDLIRVPGTEKSLAEARQEGGDVRIAYSPMDALDYAKEHPEETLIVVTGDHETGGLSIGFAGTEYDTYLTLLENQKISFEQFDAQYSVTYNRNTPFETVLADIEECFGLTVDSSGKMLKLNGYEQEVLKTAFEKTVGTLKGMSVQESKILYGDYEPITVAVTHILNNKAGLSWSSFSHTGLPVAVFADGTGAELFDGFYDNTEIFYKLADLLNVE